MLSLVVISSETATLVGCLAPIEDALDRDEGEEEDEAEGEEEEEEQFPVSFNCLLTIVVVPW